MPPYQIILDDPAQDWLDQQPEDVRKRVFLILREYATDPNNAGVQLQNATRWYDDLFGWARQIRIDSVYPGLRCIYYVFEKEKEMIIFKFGTHADDVYEDSN